MATRAWRVSSRATVAQRWLARLSLAAAAAAVLVLLAVAGAKSLALVAVGAAGLAVTAAGVWWTLSRRGVLRLLAVALVAAERGIPLLVISAGTRNHFALDLGLDRDDPSRCLDALTDGVGLLVDLGFIGGRPFVNNASFGAYAAVVQSPAYRADKAETTLNMLPELLAGHRGPRLRLRAGSMTIDGPQAVLVSNNTYGMGDVAGLGRRSRLDGGVLGVLGVRVGSALQAAGLLRGRHWRGLTVRSAREAVIEADASHIPVGVDGEALSLPTPVRCTVRPKALQVRVPRNRPGVPLPKPPMNWRLLGRMTLTR